MLHRDASMDSDAGQHRKLLMDLQPQPPRRFGVLSIASSHAPPRASRSPGVGSMGALVALLLLALVSLSGLSSSLVQPVAGVCVDPSPLKTGDKVNIAVLVYVNASYGLFTGNLSDTTVTKSGFGAAFVQPYMLGVELYINAMRARGNILPLPNGESVELNFVYINLANMHLPAGLPMPDHPGDTIPTSWGDWNYDVAFQGVPYFLYLAQTDYVPGSFVYPGSIFPYPAPPGMLYRLISKDPAVLAEFGVTEPFTFIIPSIMMLEDATVSVNGRADAAARGTSWARA
jgi:hypothetical protein